MFLMVGALAVSLLARVLEAGAQPQRQAPAAAAAATATTRGPDGARAALMTLATRAVRPSLVRLRAPTSDRGPARRAAPRAGGAGDAAPALRRGGA
jgi:hypothetical protein